MPDEQTVSSPEPAARSGKTEDDRPSRSHRVVHVSVPEVTFNHAKAQAYLSGMRFPEYVERVLKEGRPYPGPGSPLSSDDVQTEEQLPNGDRPKGHL